ncbi:MAG: bifunctional nuclease family protein, partial [Candidatus Rokubacteria bacterium]|nr:bifunctional nuclease family protein [Candidatus Rokubacteria bacterium]
MGERRRIATLGLLLVCGTALLAAGGKSEVPSPRALGPQEVEVVGLLLSPNTLQPTVVLQGKRDKRTFAMAIGAAEATGIAFPLQNLTPPRP